jgi:ribose-phosphate pyrophosphokinase
VKSATAACVHPILSDQAVEKICGDDLIDELVVTDTIPLPPHKRHPKITVLSVAPLIGDAITRIHTGEGVSDLFR